MIEHSGEPVSRQSWSTPALEMLGVAAQAESGPERTYPYEDSYSALSGPR